jgi:hypothetical protein
MKQKIKNKTNKNYTAGAVLKASSKIVEIK